MKTKQIIIGILAVLLMALGQANAGEKELTKNKVPKAVLEAFEKAYPNVKDMKFESEMFEGKSAIEVEFKVSGKENEALYDFEGLLLQNEEEIEVSALPAAVTEAVKKAHPKAKIKEAEKLMKPDGTLVGYEVEVKTGKKEVELELDAGGKILKTQ